MKAPAIPTPHKALAAAINKALEEPLNGRLTEAVFGRYAATDAGWYYRLVFLREVANVELAHLDETIARRVEFIVDCWEKNRAVRMALAAYSADSGEGEAR